MTEKKEFTFELRGLSCGSCESLIKRIAEQEGAEIPSINAMSGKITVRCEEEKLETLKQKFAEKGFHEKTPDERRGDPKRVVDYTKSILAGKSNTKVETTLTAYAIGSISMIVLIGILIFIFAPNFISLALSILPLLILLILGVVLMLFSYYHILCYRSNLSCANGMMVGMTVGMMSGFLAGALVGATNGMFIGSVVGMFFGIVQGFALGRFCGIMGAMEGIMAGIMAGTMGAMLSVMMISDHLILFLYILFILCTIMVGALSYMMHREVGPTPIKELQVGFFEFAITSVFFTILVLLIMLYGPKSGIIYP